VLEYSNNVLGKQPTEGATLSEMARANLLEAFWGLYCTKRLAEITVKEVAAKAGYNRSTFYERFDDVWSCLVELEGQCLPTFEQLPPMFRDGRPSAKFCSASTD
jgi:hypothetical protein